VCDVIFSERDKREIEKEIDRVRMHNILLYALSIAYEFVKLSKECAGVLLTFCAINTIQNFVLLVHTRTKKKPLQKCSQPLFFKGGMKIVHIMQ